ncbi:MAG: pyrroline-5-carboxylate reductase [Candidatus Methanomethylicaceae archaeon]
MSKMSLAVIGYGKMGSSLIKGALKSGLIIPGDTKVFDTDGERADLARKDGLVVIEKLDSVAGSDAVLLSVKPKDMGELLDKLKPIITASSTLFVSIAAGVKIAYIESKLGEGSRVVRVMPNIAASVNEAASAFTANRWVKDADLLFVGSLLKGVGLAYWLDGEDMIDSVTGISGSGPAYFFKLMKAMEEAGKKTGLSEKLARSLVAQTCKGSGALALQSDQSFDQLINAVASPGGTTEEALKVMDSKGFSETVTGAVLAAIEKSKRMSRS